MNALGTACGFTAGAQLSEHTAHVCPSVCWSWCFREPPICSGKHAFRRDLGLNVAAILNLSVCHPLASACAAAPFKPRGAALGVADVLLARTEMQPDPLCRFGRDVISVFSLVDLNKSVVCTYCQVGI